MSWLHSRLWLLACTGSILLVSCYGRFQPRDGGADEPDGGVDLCEGVTCSGHGTCFSSGADAICVCEAGYQSSGLSCIPATPADGDADSDADGDAEDCSDADPSHQPTSCAVNAGWGTSCDEEGCEDESACGAMFAGSFSMCLQHCEDHDDCGDVSSAVEVCGATDGANSYCVFVCLCDLECPCGMICRPIEETEYSVCTPGQAEG